MKLIEDYQYYDYTYVRMTWNSDDEIYEEDPDSFRRRYLSLPKNAALGRPRPSLF